MQHQDGRVPWRAAGIGLTSIATPVGIVAADPMLGSVMIGIEIVVALTVIGIVLFGSQERAERAFRLLRWIANRAEPPGPASSGGVSISGGGHARDGRDLKSVQAT